MEFVLRPWRESDIESVAKYANNEKIAQYLRDVFPYPYTKHDAEDYVLSCVSNEGVGQCTRAIVVKGEAVGSIGVFFGKDVYCKSAELGYWLAEPYWNRGIASSSIRKICQYVFDHYEIARIFAEPYAHNIGSRKALEKAGFQLEGTLKSSVYKKGVIYDSCMYALLRPTVDLE